MIDFIHARMKNAAMTNAPKNPEVVLPEKASDLPPDLAAMFLKVWRLWPGGRNGQPNFTQAARDIGADTGTDWQVIRRAYIGGDLPPVACDPALIRFAVRAGVKINFADLAWWRRDRVKAMRTAA